MTHHLNLASEADGSVDPLPKVVSILTREFIPGAPDHVVTAEQARIVFHVDPDLTEDDEKIQVALKTSRELADAFTALGVTWTKIADSNEALLDERESGE